MAKKTQKTNSTMEVGEIGSERLLELLENGVPFETQYITQPPSFLELCEIRDKIKNLQNSLASLADGSDTPQRATDLLDCAVRLAAEIMQITTCQ